MFSSLTDDSCQVVKQSFKEEGASCYILEDEGSYFTLMMAVFVYYVLVWLINKLIRSRFLEEKVVEKMGWVFWFEYIEAIRLDLFINLFIVLTKLDFVNLANFSLTLLNFLISIALRMVLLTITLGQLITIHKAYKRHKRRSETKNQANLPSQRNQSRRKDAQRDQRDQNESTNKPMIEATEGAKGSQNEQAKTEVQSIQEKGACIFNQDNKTDKFYQRYHSPFGSLKDFLLAFVVVNLHDTPILQTSLVSIILLIYLLLDYLYKPFEDPAENSANVFRSSIFFAMSIFFAALAIFEGKVDSEVRYYAIGYPIISMMILVTVKDLFGGLKRNYLQFKQKLQNCGKMAKTEAKASKASPQKFVGLQRGPRTQHRPQEPPAPQISDRLQTGQNRHRRQRNRPKMTSLRGNGRYSRKHGHSRRKKAPGERNRQIEQRGSSNLIRNSMVMGHLPRASSRQQRIGFNSYF